MEMRDPSLEAQEPDKEHTLNQVEESASVTENAEGTNAPDKEPADYEPMQAQEPEFGGEEAVSDLSTGITKESVIDAARAIEAKDAADITRDEVSRLRQQFGALRKAEIEAQRSAWTGEGNAPEDFVVAQDEQEEQFRTIIESIKNKKNEWLARQETLRAANLDKKNAIIAEIISLAEDTDNVNRTFQRYRELQDEFNAAGDVPPTEETAVWKRFQEARERYSDNLKINKELRDYDFKKNLDSKQLLIEEALRLTEEPDVITAFKRLQDLHSKWREIGPVSKEIREEIWNKFKDASAVINRRYQAFFEERKAREAENEQGKIEICQRVEALDFSELKSFSAWDEMTKTIIAAQEDWKKLGFASKKMNNALFARFRETCDRFFTAKATYFKTMKEELASNLAKKTALAERAEALKDSTDWKKTTDEMIALQKEWKTVGAVAKKHSETVWKRFLTACDYFFDQKKKATSGVRQAEQANLKAKREIIARLGEITPEIPKEEAIKLLRDLQNQWQEIGHVPYKEKDRIYDTYRAKVNELRDSLDLKEARERMDRFESAVAEIDGDEDKLYRERERLIRVSDIKRGELRTYENNLGFLNSKSKTGDSMLREFQRKIGHIKEEIATLEEKIRLIDSKL